MWCYTKGLLPRYCYFRPVYGTRNRTPYFADSQRPTMFQSTDCDVALLFTVRENLFWFCFALFCLFKLYFCFSNSLEVWSSIKKARNSMHARFWWTSLFFLTLTYDMSRVKVLLLLFFLFARGKPLWRFVSWFLATNDVVVGWKYGETVQGAYWRLQASHS